MIGVATHSLGTIDMFDLPFFYSLYDIKDVQSYFIKILFSTFEAILYIVENFAYGLPCVSKLWLP